MSRLATTCLVGLAAACVPAHQTANGALCETNLDCRSGHCNDGLCGVCATDADCPPGHFCGNPNCPQDISCPPAFACLQVDAGCLSFTCPQGFACDSASGGCVSTAPPVLPVCGETDSSGGYDAGWGPGPTVGNMPCYSCVGCPLGSECLCGGSGLVGGVRCSNAADALLCFATAGIGLCQIFPGDCATNTQCASTPATPHCSAQGNCVQCLSDADCPQDAGAEGCFSGTCGSCCRSDADCGPDFPICESGFCYTCPADGGCSAPDGGASSDAGVDGGTDGGLDAG